jgi:FkbM family methyltransferase
MNPDKEMGRDAYADQRTLIHANGETIIFDVGANLGNTVEKYRQLFEQGTIYAFEPDPHTHARLESRFASVERVETVRGAVAEESGTTPFYANLDPATSSLLPRPASGRRYYNRKGVTVANLEVPSIALDAFCSERGIEHIHSLKLDVQGGEGRVLKGAHGILSRMAVSLIYSEVQFTPLYQGAALFHEVCRTLRGMVMACTGSMIS